MPMPIPAELKETVDAALASYCQHNVPAHIRDQAKLTHRWRGSKVTLVEQRRHWLDPTIWGESPVAQFRYNPDAKDWRLFWRDDRERWHRYEDHPGARNISRLLVEVDQDPVGLFWG